MFPEFLNDVPYLLLDRETHTFAVTQGKFFIIIITALRKLRISPTTEIRLRRVHTMLEQLLTCPAL